MIIPSDNYMLLSLVNTKLRDEYRSLDELCYDEDVIKEDIIQRLESIDMTYNPNQNRFM